MKIQPDCVPCLLKRVLFQAELPRNGKEADAVKAAMQTYSENLSWDSNSARLATKVHRSAYAAMGVKDPYADLKIRADETAEQYLETVEGYVDSSDDRFAAAVRVSIIGNIMDFGSGIAIDDPDDFKDVFGSLLHQELYADDTQRIRELIEGSSSVVYIFDNCGESQFDKMLVREIRGMGKRVVGVVRGEPILNDVTEEDALRIGLDRELDKILTTNSFAIGVDMDEIDDELREEMRNAGVIIAKGMANYESLSDECPGAPVAYLLRAKCIPVASSLGVPVGSNIAVVRP